MNFNLKNHPFAVEANFEFSLVFSFAFPKEKLAPFLTYPLTLDLFEDKWAFYTIAMVKTNSLRIKGMPSFMGNDFFLIGHRLFVRYNTSFGKNYRGLYILKSETDQKKMMHRGNIFTHYNYSQVDINVKEELNTLSIQSEKAQFSVKVKEDVNAKLPAGSIFNSWKDARKFAGPLPFTFTINEAKKETLIIEGVRQNWKPKPVEIIDCDFQLDKIIGVEGGILSNVFMVKDIPYYWKKGKRDPWK